MNIYEKMSAITEEIATVAKNLTVGEGRSQYKAVGEGDILSAVKPLEIKHKVYSYPVSTRIVDADMLESESTYNGNTKKSTKFFMRLERTYRFVDMENPADYIDVVSYGDGIDSGDKAPGKAMTYADKYALMKAYKIRTGDDPDQTASEDASISRTGRSYGRSASADTAASSGTGQVCLCTECGQVIQDTVTRAGETWTADKIAAYSTRRHGRALCPACQKKVPVLGA